MKLSIVIPVYNGAQSIGQLVDLLVEQLRPLFSLEIVLVNDCSPDHSKEVCISTQKKHQGIVKFYSLAKNVGEHNAVMAGLNHITGDYAVIMDDDFQNPVSEVVKLAQYAEKNSYDVVYTYYEEKKHSAFRNLGSWFNDKVANVMLQKPKHLYLSSFKILSSFLAKEITQYTLPFPYIDGLILRTTTNIGQLKVEHATRSIGRSNYTLKKLVSLWSNMFINFSILPLRVCIILGFIFAAFGFLFGLWTLVEKLQNPHLPLGYSSLVVIFSLFSGIQLVALGMIGEYIGRMFLSQNKKPQFVIRERFE